MSRNALASLGKIPTTLVRRLGPGVESFDRVGRPDLGPVGSREGGECAHVLSGVEQHGRHLGKLALRG